MSKRSFLVALANALVATLLTTSPALADDALRRVEYNSEELVMISVSGQISMPGMNRDVYQVTADGEAQVLPSVGGITYNFRVGDSAVRLAGNHVEPAVSIFNAGADNDRNGHESRALNSLANIGNEVMVASGDAKGERGIVIGKHGGIEHIIVDFRQDEVYDKLVIGDVFQIRGYGTGMRLTNVEDVTVMNTGPKLLDALNKNGMGVTADGRLRIGVTHFIPAKIMGSGLGARQTYTGDYDIQFFDSQAIEEYDLASLRFGDVVAIIDADNTYGRVYRQGAITIGSVSHGRSDSAGHGPGVTTLFTSKDGLIEPYKKADANLAVLLDIRKLQN